MTTSPGGSKYPTLVILEVSGPKIYTLSGFGDPKPPVLISYLEPVRSASAGRDSRDDGLQRPAHSAKST